MDTAHSQVGPPSIVLPKGGGAIRGIDEKFTTNPATGTATLTVRIPTSPGRSGFGPALTISYDSGSGNGPFGLGWSLTLPRISRKTDQGLPRYRDDEESDVFVLSGAEDLVPVLRKDGSRWEERRSVGGIEYRIQRYRPRIEGLFARIERWTSTTDPADCFWRSISGDGITTWYGRSPQSRIADPEEPRRVFAWLICESYDGKGNAIVYEYKAEDSQDVDIACAHERNRTEEVRSANRYLKRVRYGNRTPYLPTLAEDDPFPAPPSEWLFEVVFDYGEHDAAAPLSAESAPWPARPDPFSTYRAGFEVRTYRLCHRVLMFHHFPDEPGIGDGCLVRSMDFAYATEAAPTSARHPAYSRLVSVTQCGYRRQPGGGYLKRTFPPLEFEYTGLVVHDSVQELDAASLEGLPYGLDGVIAQWLDLDGEGVSGVLIREDGGWYYKRNPSPAVPWAAEQRLWPAGEVARRPALAMDADHEFVDLAGDGQLDLATFAGPLAGFHERTPEEGWGPFVPFQSVVNVGWDDPNLRLVDLTGDGHADILVTEDEAICWYPSLGERGFGPAERLPKPLDEEQGPRVLFADGTQSLFLANLSGDGLSDIVRVRNGEVCYWPNLGYGRFGARVTMDNSPWFDSPDQFDPTRLRLADIDGSGTADIVYLGRDGVRIYFNQSGNAWSQPAALESFPHVDSMASVQVLDLLGSGTSCLVWSSPLPGDAGRQVRYVDIAGGQKPHLLTRIVNNLGTETRIFYAPSTRFYQADRLAGRPWITRLPFPVHVVERVETYDHVSRNRFVTRYAYHHGYFDGLEREFRGFGLVEQWDTEQFASLAEGGDLLTGDNWDEASHVPPVYTKTWFHTGLYLGRDRVSNYFAGLSAGGTGEYYREPGLSDEEARARLLPDTVLPDGLTAEEEREACRALKGLVLRQEVYALDGSDRQTHPYTVTEQSFGVRVLQRRGANRHGVFLTHPRESLAYHYERDPADPRLQHTLTLEVDGYGNVLKSASVAYGRRRAAPGLSPEEQTVQATALVTYTEAAFTNAVDWPDAYRVPLTAETVTYELTGYPPTGPGGRYQPSDFVRSEPDAPDRLASIFDGELRFEEEPGGGRERRPVERLRTLYRRDDLSDLLPLRQLESLALPGETYRLALTPGLLSRLFQRQGESLLPDAAAILGGRGPDQGGYVDLDGDGHWWVPAGRVFYIQNPAASASQELAAAREHFFLPVRFRDPFGQETTVTYDRYDLLLVEVRDPLGNVTTAGERLPDGRPDPARPGNDYRVLQPRLLSDANRNRSAVVFDALGVVVATAVMGKPEEDLGDSLEGLEPDPPESDVLACLDDPLADPHSLLQGATSRLVYDLFAYIRTREGPRPLPVAICTLERESHESDLTAGQRPRVRPSLSYWDGFGRQVQRKALAEPGPVPVRDAEGRIVLGPDGQPQMTMDDASERWVASGWTVFNNKGKPVRQYEPFFTDTPRFEFEVRAGVGPLLLYDPAERLVATLRPDHAWEKVVFGPWHQERWDANDTVLIDPASDPDVGALFRRLPPAEYRPTWHALRTAPAHADAFAARYQDATERAAEAQAARKTELHSATPIVTCFDSLGRPFLTVARNRYRRGDAPPDSPPVEEIHRTLVGLDIQGRQRRVADALGRLVMRYEYDMLGTRLHQASMDAGRRWLLHDVTGKLIRSWNSRGLDRRLTYDALRRPTALYVREEGVERLVERTVYGEGQGEAGNHRTRVFRQYDQAGVATNLAFDFKGNLLASARQFAREYRTTLDWSDDVPLESEVYEERTTYDALDRPVSLRSADGSVVRYHYNEASLLERIEAHLRGAATPTGLVADLDYNAKGQRERIVYDNGAVTTYDYDPLTFRLKRLRTTRNGAALQALTYTYDPAGNITHIRDDAQQTVYFDNAVVQPHAEYTYDAVYRLIEATGREHIGQSAALLPASWDDGPRVRLPHPHDGQAMRRYTERYEYDAVGNLLRLVHRAQDGDWTRECAYEEPSLLEPARASNRLSRTVLGAIAEPYGHDAHGNMTSMPHLSLMRWDFDDQLRATARQAVSDGGTPETTYYVYDAAGQRLRKVTERQAGSGQMPTRLREHLYLGVLEVYREYGGDGATVTLERQALHIMDDKRCVALIETRTQGSDPAPAQLVRYQLGNHLGSTILELDAAGQVISYEEYYPYGGTSYQALRRQTETPKRRRYAGKERDAETGLYYYGARYYAPWLGRWTSYDPAGLADGLNLYWYARCSPIVWHDASGRQSTRNQELIDPVIVRRAEVTGEESQEWVRQQYAEVGIFYRGEAQWDPEHRTWWVDRAQLIAPEIITFSEEEADVITAQLPSETSRQSDSAEGPSESDSVLDAVQMGLDVVGLIPGIGEVADAANAIISLARGDYVGAALSAAAMIPFAGWGATAGKAGRRVANVVERRLAREAVEEATEQAVRHADPATLGTLVGTSTRQMRRAAAKKIAETEGHPLRFLLDESGKFKSSGRQHSELIERPDVVEMGHITSKLAGGPERVMLQAAWLNQFNRVTVEGTRKGAFIENVAVDIGGIAVDRESAIWWEQLGWLPKGTVANAPRLVFP